MDLSSHRPRPPEVVCGICHKHPDSIEDTGLHLGFSRSGVVLIQVKCHGDTQNIAATFKWLRANPGYVIIAFVPSEERYGLEERDLKLISAGPYPDVSCPIREVKALENVK